MTVTALGKYGLESMDEAAIREFLTNRGVGVLGLPTEDGPYLLSMSYGCDGDAALYFTYVGGDDSRKASLSDRAETAGFLVYGAGTAFTWASVFLRGALERVPEPEGDVHGDAMSNAWRPAVFETADVDVAVYRFRIAERSGIRHTGLPPGFEPRESESG
ncbi:pyridoxamine 5'-phosphate oxidase family protein [Halobacteriales archaeon QS_1_68_17]|nr:MAG: pyridoxamine 5'-phosphate oxidase family protein [Halobacteriales archaeon QS_1_68_17]